MNQIINNFLFFALCYGFAYIVAFSTLFENFRSLMFKINKTLGKLFSCILCFGTWTGMIFSLFFGVYKGIDLSFFSYINGLEWYYKTFFDGVTTGGLCYFIYYLVEGDKYHNLKIEEKENNKNNIILD